MNTVLAKNVKTIREIKHWTQQHLADTAGILVRTVQRVEKGDGGSLETLGALANAFGVSIDLLQTDMDALMASVRKAQEELDATHDLVQVAPVTCSADLELIGDSDAISSDCVTKDDESRDAFAALISNLTDMLDIWNDVDPTHHRGWIRGAYEQVEALSRLGVVVSVGSGRRTMKTGAGSVTFRTAYVIAWTRGQEKTVIAVPKGA